MKSNFGRALLGSFGMLVAVWGVGAPGSLEKLTMLGYYDEVDLNLSFDGPAPDAVVAGTTVSLNLVVANNGESGASDVELLFASDSLVHVVEASCPVYSETFCRVGELPAGSAEVVTVTLAIDPDALGRSDFLVAAESSQVEGNPGDELAQQVLTIVEEADVAIEFSDDPEVVGPGGQAIVWLSVYNSGPSNAYGIRVGFDPEAFSIDAWDCFSVGSFDCLAFSGEGPINQNINIGADGSIHYRLRLTAPLSEGQRELTASASYVRDILPSNNTVVRELRIEDRMFTDRFE
ncbi:COG1361 family protein [Wenzhouxiangella sp. EGI_FJ10409]|uniref:hypothetical protein n=1 Tax=Wenzhouxiangella sp. EGI_FJ10409 TaxID=3243767 RepID=UPI0035DEADBC